MQRYLLADDESILLILLIAFATWSFSDTEDGDWFHLCAFSFRIQDPLLPILKLDHLRVDDTLDSSSIGLYVVFHASELLGQ